MPTHASKRKRDVGDLERQLREVAVSGQFQSFQIVAHPKLGGDAGQAVVADVELAQLDKFSWQKGGNLRRTEGGRAEADLTDVGGQLVQFVLGHVQNSQQAEGRQEVWKLLDFGAAHVPLQQKRLPLQILREILSTPALSFLIAIIALICEPLLVGGSHT